MFGNGATDIYRRFVTRGLTVLMSKTTINAQRQLGVLVAENPRYASVFESFDIDYCCGGDVTLERACLERDLDVETVREQLDSVERPSDDKQIGRDSPSILIDHIIETHHDYLREELPELRSLIGTVTRAHGENHPELRDVEAVFEELSEEMLRHIEEEEEDGFPIIEKLAAGEPLSDDAEATIRSEIEHFEEDHSATAELLDRIAELTDDYDLPDDACSAYRAMLDRLKTLEEDTHMHVHRENNILFPAAEELLTANE